MGGSVDLALLILSLLSLLTSLLAWYLARRWYREALEARAAVEAAKEAIRRHTDALARLDAQDAEMLVDAIAHRWVEEKLVLPAVVGKDTAARMRRAHDAVVQHFTYRAAVKRAEREGQPPPPAPAVAFPDQVMAIMRGEEAPPPEDKGGAA